MSETIRGAKSLLKAFEKLEKSVQRDVLVRAAKTGAEPIAVRARQLAPRDTGDLAEKGIQVKRTARRRKYGECSVTNRKRASHAVLQEYGVQPHMIGKKKHPGHKPQPFFRPAFDELKDEAGDNVTEALDREILKAAK